MKERAERIAELNRVNHYPFQDLVSKVTVRKETDPRLIDMISSMKMNVTVISK